MSKLTVYNNKGNKVGEAELIKEIADCKVNEAAIYQTVKAYLASQRAGLASTKARSEVRGGGTKPWRQKGTGRARAGSIRSPLWVGGGVTFGPKPRDYSFSVPKKLKKLALKSALKLKADQKDLLVLDSFELKEAKTKKAAEIFKKLKVGEKTMVVLDKTDETVERAVRNIPFVDAVLVNELNSYYVLYSNKLVFTKSSLKALAEVL